VNSATAVMTEASVKTQPIKWQLATVTETLTETPTARTLFLDAPEWMGHLPGQHVDVRLTAEDGYQTQRSYSIGSAPEDARLALTIERLDDGEVSPYLCDELRVGDQLELRGAIGGHFVWNVGLGGPLLLVAGGSGIVPLMSMLRHRRAAQADGNAAARGALPTWLLYSSRRWDAVIYRDELARLAATDETLTVTHTLTREAPEGWKGFRRRIDRAMLADLWPAADKPRVFVCGPTPLVESVAEGFVELGHSPERIKLERFGPTGV
jgi:ferredoxin-NADP reductase